MSRGSAVWVIIFFFCSANVLADPVDIDRTYFYIEPYESLEIFEDTTAEMTLEEVIQMDFQPNPDPHLIKGLSASVFWFRMNIRNRLQADQKIYFQFQNHFLEDIDIYIFNDDSLVTTQHLGLANDPPKSFSRKTFFSHVVAGNDEIEIYFSVRSRSPLRIPVGIMSDSYLSYFASRNNFIYGAFYGLVIFLSLFSVMLIFVTRERIYLYYFLTLAALVLYQVGFDNILNFAAEGNRYAWVLYRLTATAPLALLASTFFAEEFFMLKEKDRWVKRILLVIKIVAAVLFLVFQVSYYFGNTIVKVFVPMGYLVIIVISVILWSDGRKYLRFFVLASVLFFTALAFHVVAVAGLVDNTFFTLHGVKVGYMANIIVYTIAVVDRYGYNQRRISQVMEQKVAERTRELRENLDALKRTQQQLIQSEKMASIGALTSGVAHEINNPLNFIQGGLSMLEKEIASCEAEIKGDQNIIATSVEAIREGITRISRIMGALASFSANDSMVRREVNIHDMIENLVIILRPRLNRITVVRDFGYNGTLRCLEHQVQTALSNILDNAMHAVEQGHGDDNGKIIFRTSREDGFLRIDIENTGPHIPENELLNIFEPFYTTREPDKGAGLGLSIARSYIIEHRGNIEISNTETGVKCSVWLPEK